MKFSLLGVAGFLVALLLAACAGLAVRGNIGGQSIATRVDSEVARYYLASYLRGQKNNPDFDHRIAGVYKHAWDPLESTCRHASLSIL